ncbi:MAG TPA: M56 family metallopeptidase [Rhizomicrobium sp.]|nr:M56 family metallopeptidase [Rhizomicrobium sp.]
MSEFVAKSALLFAGEMFLLSAVILALAWEVAQAIRNRAALRHLVWVGAFVALIALPVLALLVPSQFHVLVFSAPAVSEHAMVAPAADTAPVAAAQAPARFALPDIHVDLQSVVAALFAVWLAGAIALALRAAAAAIGLRALKRQSRPHNFANSDLIVGPRYDVRLSRAPNGYGPITWGLLRPVILLPFNAHFWPRERLQAVLLHETAHIARRDSLSQLLSMIACTLYWPNPLVWMASRALRNEAEIAADDAVIASGMRPSSYAGELLQLASEFRSREPALAGMPLFMAAPSALEARVKSVLAPTPQRSGVTSMDVLKIGSIALLATTALTFARPSFAQEEPSSPPLPPSPPAVVSAPLPPPAAPANIADAAPAAPAALPAPAPVPTAPTPAAVSTPAPVPALASPAALPAPATIAQFDAHRYVKVRERESTVHGHTIHHVWVDVDGRALSQAEIARVRPQIERAEAQARDAEAEVRAHEAEIREIQARMPEIEAQVQAEMAKMQPEIERAVAEARLNNVDLQIHEHMDKAMKHMNLRIEMKEKKVSPHAPQDDEAPDEN